MQAGRFALAAMTGASLLILGGAAAAAEIKVMATAAIKEAYLELVPQFEKVTEHKVATIWTGSVDVMKRLGGGEVVDLVIMPRPSIDALTNQGKIVSQSRVNLARSGVGVAVRAGAPHPDISSADALKQAMLAAKSIAYSTGPSGTYLAGLFERMGIADAVKGKTKIARPGTPVGDIIARGEAEIGFQQVSELLPVAGIDYIGPLPPEIQLITITTAGLHTAATQARAAKALVEFLTSPQAAPVLKKKGMEPG
jgi:molybdate transport system substrate-binding protein